MKSKFYGYHQNNSGGDFVFDEEAGITHEVIIEAVNAYDANNRAETIGLYFDGHGDCPCCGNRWYRVYGDDDSDEPKVYGLPVAQAVSFTKWRPDKEICVHYMDGRKEWFDVKKVSYEEQKAIYAAMAKEDK